MTRVLPPPLLLRPGHSSPGATPTPVSVVDGAAADPERAKTFGALLAQSRAARGLHTPLEIFASTAPDTPPPPSPPGRVWLPHVFCWQTIDSPAVAWELCGEADVGTLVGGDAALVAQWACHLRQLLRVVEMAGTDGRSADLAHEKEHLSLRWILAHHDDVAEVLSGAVIAVEHVSIHIDPDDDERVARVLIEALGLVEVPRPGRIEVAGRWLQAGACRIHLNARPARENEPGFPGTAPNHVCFAVADLDAAEHAVRSAGFETRRAGSLGGQVWFRLPGGTVIELQPRRGRNS